MTIFPLDANRQNVDILQIGQAPANAQNSVYRSTGSKLLDSLKHHNTVSTATVLFGVDTANGLGLQHLEIPALNSTALNSTALNTNVRRHQSAEPRIARDQTASDKTAREQAVSRIAHIIKQDRTSVATVR